jgi:hypothetical protein
MSADDERDLSSAFEELTAPPSTANYATRTSGLDIRTSLSRWPQALATVLTVLVAVGGAGTFLALRNARQGGAPSSAVGNPPARSGAAMAYDSTAGVTVMFGGTGASGAALTDTWTWNGSVWTSAPHGPGPLADVRMVDDPVNAGVLLVGMPVPASSGGAVGCAGSGTASPGYVTGTTPVASTAPSAKSKPSVPTGIPGLSPVRPTGPPLADPVPTGTLATAPAESAPAGFVCPPPVVAPPEQTWLFTSGGWRRVRTGSATPPAGSQLAFDGTTRQVVAVSGGAYSCGPPLSASVNASIPGSAYACPVIGSSTSSSGPSQAAGAMPCCPTDATGATWTWSGATWVQSPAGPVAHGYGATLVFNDPATDHATLMVLAGNPNLCPAIKSLPMAPCPAIAVAPSVTTWTWTGSAWQKVSEVPNHQQAPALGGAVAAVRGHIVVLTDAGETWTFAGGQWTQNTVTVTTHPDMRFGAAMAEGPSGTVVLFGGVAAGGFIATAPGGSLGSDTWTWNGSDWRHVGGHSPLPPVTPTCPAQVKGGAIPPCAVQPQPAQVSPGVPVAPPATPTPTP